MKIIINLNRLVRVSKNTKFFKYKWHGAQYALFNNMFNSINLSSISQEAGTKLIITTVTTCAQLQGVNEFISVPNFYCPILFYSPIRYLKITLLCPGPEGRNKVGQPRMI